MKIFKALSEICALIFIFSVIFISCDKGKDTTQIQEIKFVNPQTDIAGFLNPFEKTLYVSADHKEKVLKALGAEITEENMYVMQGLTPSLKSIQINFRLQITTLPDIYVNYRNYDEFWGWKVDVHDSLRGRLVGRFKDSMGTAYAVYVNARCEKMRDGFVDSCRSHKITRMEYVHGPDTSRWVTRVIDTGKFMKSEFSQINKCLKGNDYCVEALVVSKINKFYIDVNCTQMIDQTLFFDFSCIAK